MTDEQADAWTIATLDELLARYGEPGEASLRKETQALTPAYRRWIEASPFFALASAGPDGLDCSPRGDQPGGLLRIVDDRTMQLPDRRGNNRLDTLKNVLDDPRVALLFLIPGVNETLRVTGRARITIEPSVLRWFDVDGSQPATVLEIAIERVYFQCGRALLRSGLWQPVAEKARPSVPTAGEMVKAALPTFDAEGYDRALPARQRSTLY